MVAIVYEAFQTLLHKRYAMNVMQTLITNAAGSLSARSYCLWHFGWAVIVVVVYFAFHPVARCLNWLFWPLDIDLMRRYCRSYFIITLQYHYWSVGQTLGGFCWFCLLLTIETTLFTSFPLKMRAFYWFGIQSRALNHTHTHKSTIQLYLLNRCMFCLVFWFTTIYNANNSTDS